MDAFDFLNLSLCASKKESESSVVFYTVSVSESRWIFLVWKMTNEFLTTYYKQYWVTLYEKQPTRNLLMFVSKKIIFFSPRVKWYKQWCEI